MSSSIGRVENAVLRWLTKTARVASLEVLGDFRWITLEGESLRGVDWVPGQHVQMMLGGWAKRTYTPMSWDRTRGIVEILGFGHGDGPGASWLRSLEVGTACHLFGPQRSLDLVAATRPSLLFGDETSFGLARAARQAQGGGKEPHVILEVSSVASTAPMLERLELSAITLIERRDDERHVPDLIAKVGEVVQREQIAHCILSGKASSIQAVHRRARELGLSGKRIQSKPYWATGKRGLD